MIVKVDDGAAIVANLAPPKRKRVVAMKNWLIRPVCYP